jgi:prepilin-type N-terminal cleavage/methylation domain-containing protein/prepilin-type processing-associated H-X9-DG protein
MSCTRKKTNRPKGFTLIELLVVISILALLLSILMPGLQKAKESAKKVVCATNERSLIQALMLYATENNDYAYPVEKTPDGWFLGWDQALSPYFSTTNKDSNKEFFVCAADRKPRGFVDNPVYNPYSNADRLPRSYMINGTIRNMAGGGAPEWYSNESDIPTKVSRVQMSHDTIWVYEHHIGEADENLGLSRGQVGYEGCTQGTNYWDSTWWPPYVTGWTSNHTGNNVEQSDQHRNGGNWGYFDGSVTWARHLSSEKVDNKYELAFEGISFFYNQLATIAQRQKSGYSARAE